MAKTIYKVEGASRGEPSPGSPSSAPDAPIGSASTSRPARTFIDSKAKRRKLVWILLVIAVLTVAMIVAIALLGASESPAVGTVVDPETVTTFAYVPATSPEPVGTSTTMAALTVAPVSTSTSTSAGPTSTAILTHAITEPARVVISALRVDTKVVPVGLKPDKSMEVPAVGIVGWYKLGPAPGASGPTVLVSHVSWHGQKGAFYGLKDLKPGDEVQVYDSSGDCAVFQVDSLETILKTKLPTERIWNNTDQAVIRLITCGGDYDSKTGHYLSNVIVYGHLVK